MIRIEVPQASPGHHRIIAWACSVTKHEQSLSELRSQTKFSTANYDKDGDWLF